MIRHLTASLLGVKLIYIACIGAMALGSFAMSDMTHAEHGMNMETTHSHKTGCEACVDVINHWNTDMIETEESELLIIADIFSVDFLIFEQVLIDQTKATKVLPRPPDKFSLVWARVVTDTVVMRL